MGKPGQRPNTVMLVDYMYAREEEGMGPSIPLAVSTAVARFERTAGTPEEEQLMSQTFPQIVMKELTKRLEQNAPPVRRAPRWLGCFVAPMETLVIDGAVPFEVRVCAWFKLVKLWTSMRFDDAAHLKTSELRFYDGQLLGMLHQSKTSGAGKRVRELPLFIAKDAYVVHDDWLAVGFDLIKLQMPRDRVYTFSRRAVSTALDTVSPTSRMRRRSQAVQGRWPCLRGTVAGSSPPAGRGSGWNIVREQPCRADWQRLV